MVDLPRIYSLSPYSAEEIVARNYIINEKPDVLINIIDATNIERNMYLTLQILETKIPTVIALNMMDEVEARGTKINIPKLNKNTNSNSIKYDGRGRSKRYENKHT